MIPQNNNISFSVDIVTTKQPNKTYRMDIDKEKIAGNTDEREAIKQAIYKILNTERYQYVIYSWDYGIELQDLFGEPLPYVYPELERRITEALTWDDRIHSVTDFEFSNRKGEVLAKFICHTDYGEIEAEKAVRI